MEKFNWLKKFTKRQRIPQGQRCTSYRRGSTIRPTLETLESRDLLSASVVAVGADAGGGPRVSLLDRTTGAIIQNFFAYDQAFTGGVRVAVADFNNDGNPDVVTGPGPGGGPNVKVFDGKTGAVLQSFFAFDPGFTGGVNVAVGDFNKDGKPDIVVAADAGSGPNVKVFDGTNSQLLNSFFAFDPHFGGGVHVGVGDVNGDGKADLVLGAGAGGGPQVLVADGTKLNQLQADGQLAASALLSAFFAYDPAFTGGVFVSAADLTADGKADIITGAGAGGGPQVNLIDGTKINQVLSNLQINPTAVLSSFFAYDPTFTGGVRVGSFSLDASGRPGIITAPGLGGSADIRIFNAPGGIPATLFGAFDPGFRGGAFVSGSGLPAALSQLSGGTLGNFFDASPSGTALITLHLQPIDINLLGLEIQTSPITVVVSVESGDGKLLGNLLTVASKLINLDGVNNALNNVLGNVVTLLNSASLGVSVDTSGLFSTAALTTTTPVLDLFVAPVHLDLLGARVDTSSIELKITGHSGPGQILGNVITELANLFNPPLPSQLDLNFINSKLQGLLTDLNTLLPGISSPVTPVTITSTSQILRLSVPPIDLNLLGLVLQTSEIKVNADALSGDGLLLGNVLTTLFNTLGATPQNLSDLSNNLNGILAKVVGVLNASSLTLSAGAVGSLTQVLQTLSLPNLVNTTGTSATAPILNLSIASPDGTTPPVDVNLLGLNITTSNIDAQLFAQTGDGQILGNLVFNVAHLLDPGGSLNLLTVLNLLGV